MANLTNYAGKVPPQAMDLEEAVLGALMIDSNAIETVYSILKPDTFYKSAHFEIYNAMSKIYELSDKIDMLTVVQKLKELGKLEAVGGRDYIMGLTDRVMSATNIESHSLKLSELYTKRLLIKAGQDILAKAYDATEDAFEVLDYANNRLYNIEQNSASDTGNTMLHFAKKAMLELDNPDVAVIPTGIPSIDKAIGGGFLLDGSFNVISAPPSMGKTAFAVYLARSIAKNHGHNVGILSMEMSGVLMTTRQMVTEFHYHNLSPEYGTPTFEKFATKKMSELEKEGLRMMLAESAYLNDIHIVEGSFNLNEIIAKMRYLKKTHNVKVIMIDYLQLIDLTTNKTKADELQVICRRIIKEAKRLKVAVVALAQMNRDLFKRQDKKPQLTDLGDGSAIEKNADNVIFLHRPEYYGEHIDPITGKSTKGMLMLIIAKKRFSDDSGVSSREHLVYLHPQKKTIHEWSDDIHGADFTNDTNASDTQQGKMIQPAF